MDRILYRNSLSKRAAAAGFKRVELEGPDPEIWRRSKWFAGLIRMKIYLAVSDVDDLIERDQLESFSEKLLTRKAGIAATGIVGAQNGVIVMAVLVGDSISSDAARFADGAVVTRFAKLAYPIGVALEGSDMHALANRPFIGRIFHGWVRAQIDLIVSPDLVGSEA